MTPVRKSTPPEKKNVTTIGGDVVDSVIVTGDNNQTIIQKFFNIFKSDSETLEHRNCRILLGHVENAWIKGVLDASLHGAALLDLGIKQDPEAVTKYPWAIKKESTDETLPAGTSMLEIFDSIGMGRSLLILGAPGSGKTTMLLELARQLIARAREDVAYPIPMVFNLSSWTESKTLADWLAQELNNLYSVPRKTAPDWVKGNKLLLLLDGLDEVRQDSRAKCVEAINAFRKEHGLTSLAVCSRSQDYADLNAKLSFEGAIEVQPLTHEQIAEFFNRFGEEMAGIKQVLKKDNALRAMAETPLFLSIMIMAYRDKRDVEILISGDEKLQHKRLFDTYIERMFERPRSKNANFKKQDVLHWLSWLARKMVKHNQIPYFLENMQPNWLSQKNQGFYRVNIGLIPVVIIGLIIGLISGLIYGLIVGIIVGLIILLFGCAIFLTENYTFGDNGIEMIDVLDDDEIKTVHVLEDNETEIVDDLDDNEIEMVDALEWDWIEGISGMIVFGVILGLFSGLVAGLSSGLLFGLFFGLLFGLLFGLGFGLMGFGLDTKSVDQPILLGQRVAFLIRNFLFIFLLFGLIVGLSLGLLLWLYGGLIVGIKLGLLFGLICGLGFGLIFLLKYGGSALFKHCILRFNLAFNKFTPWRLVPFLNHCVDLIFLRRVGGGYIFVHRLLMEHFAERLNHD